MAERDDSNFRIKPGRSRTKGSRVRARDLPFLTQVKIAVRQAGGNPNRIGREGGGMRFRSRRVVVKARVVQRAGSCCFT